MTENGLHDKMQSAYKLYHSTETALLRVQNDILQALDCKSGVYLALIDLSAAFDTVDHQILLTFLQDTIRIHGSAWNWFHSYLTGQKKQVIIEDVLSELCELLYGVPWDQLSIASILYRLVPSSGHMDFSSQFMQMTPKFIYDLT